MKRIVLRIEALCFRVIAVVIIAYATTPSIGESSTCLTVYKEGGAPAVFKSPNALAGISNYNSRQRTTSRCQMAMLQGRRKSQEDRTLCALDLRIPFPGFGCFVQCRWRRGNGDEDNEGQKNDNKDNDDLGLDASFNADGDDDGDEDNEDQENDDKDNDDLVLLLPLSISGLLLFGFAISHGAEFRRLGLCVTVSLRQRQRQRGFGLGLRKKKKKGNQIGEEERKKIGDEEEEDDRRRRRSSRSEEEEEEEEEEEDRRRRIKGLEKNKKIGRRGDLGSIRVWRSKSATKNSSEEEEIGSKKTKRRRREKMEKIS
ncbi:hypothetical protein LWI29_008627 [Acer saccharum]|uniref:Transmembrane protein n=1 Tax=Acer saccharum TaxID=4024 RepID=A0AA39VK03_ACESA|nr:hypothetical protein LWI29_008627 [Acer saccharum]